MLRNYNKLDVAVSDGVSLPTFPFLNPHFLQRIDAGTLEVASSHSGLGPDACFAASRLT
jgi:hypothetical protein